MKKSEIKNIFRKKNVQDIHLINNMLFAIEGALKLDQVKSNVDISDKLKSFKKELKSMESPVCSEPKSVNLENQRRAAFLGSKTYLLILNI